MPHAPLLYIQISTVSVINWWPTTVTSLSHWPSTYKLTAPETIDVTTHMVGAHQNLNDSRDLTTPLSGMVCHPWASTCYRQRTYQIWSLYLHSLRRYERRNKILKTGWFRVIIWSLEVTGNSTIWWSTHEFLLAYQTWKSSVTINMSVSVFHTQCQWRCRER